MDSSVPYPNAPRVGDVQYGPPTNISHSNHLINHVVTPSQSKQDIVDLYTTGGKDGNATTTRPFIHQVGLQGTKGGYVYLKGLFDNGALVNAICSSIFKRLTHILGHLQPSTKTLRMADGSHVKSHGRWVGNVGLGGRTVHTAFEIFPQRERMVPSIRETITAGIRGRTRLQARHPAHTTRRFMGYIAQPMWENGYKQETSWGD